MVSFIVDMFAFSPNGLYLAHFIQTEKQIILRNCDFIGDTSTNHPHDLSKVIKVIQKINLGKRETPVDKLSWSPDSQLIAVSCNKFAVISIFSVEDPHWSCKVSLGILDSPGGIGLQDFWWGRDARHVLCYAEESTCLAIYSLKDKMARYLKHLPTSVPCHSFSPDGSLLAVVHIDEEHDYSVAIYDTSATWTKQYSFPVSIRDFGGLSWDPGRSCSNSNGRHFIAIWDSVLYSNLYVYEVTSGRLVKQYSPYGMTTGFETVEWSSCGNFIVCTANNKNEVHVLNGLTFGVLIHDVLEPSFSDFGGAGGGLCTVIHETEKTECDADGIGNRLTRFCRVSKMPSKVMEQLKSCHLKVHASLWGKATHAELHPSGRYLACRTHIYPHFLWIYDLVRANVSSIIIYKRPILDFDWHPTQIKLIVLSQSSSSSSKFQPPDNADTGPLSCWTPDKCMHIQMNGISWKSLRGCSSLECSSLGNLIALRNDFGRVHILQCP